MIIVTSVIKNAADVIEAMVRGNSSVADGFVFVDHCSTDRTCEILESLKGEGYIIDILSDDTQSHYQKSRMEKAIEFALDKYSPDYILPLDDDEILVTNTDDLAQKDVKANMEGLPQDNLYYISWRNYIPTEVDDMNITNVVLRERFCFDDEPEMTKKVMIPGKIAKDPGFSIGQGNHFADAPSVKGRVHLSDLRIAHFPIRSAIQVASKALVGWINHLTMPDREENTGYHWERMYNVVLNGGLPTVDLMQAMCTLYREYPNDEEHLNIVCRPVSLPEEYTTLKYTGNNEINLLKNVCYNAEGIAKAYAKLLERS